MSGGKSESGSDSFARAFMSVPSRRAERFMERRGRDMTNQMMNRNRTFQKQFRRARQTQRELMDPRVSPQFKRQLEQGTNQINRNLQENVLPSIGANSQMVGQVGSSRQGIAEGLASRAAIESQADFQSDMRFNEHGRMQNQRMQALGFTPMISQMQMQPLQQFSSIMGRPTILNQSEGDSNSKGKQMGFGSS